MHSSPRHKGRKPVSQPSRYVRALTDDFDLEPVEVIERNGNLALVENERGETRWLAPFELEEE